MRARELPADLGDLRRGLAVGEDDLGKPDASLPVEVESEIGDHGGILSAAGRFQAEERIG